MAGDKPVEDPGTSSGLDHPVPVNIDTFTLPVWTSVQAIASEFRSEASAGLKRVLPPLNGTSRSAQSRVLSSLKEAGSLPKIPVVRSAADHFISSDLSSFHAKTSLLFAQAIAGPSEVDANRTTPKLLIAASAKLAFGLAR